MVSTPWVPLAHRQPADSARRLLVLRDLVAWQHPLGDSNGRERFKPGMIENG